MKPAEDQAQPAVTLPQLNNAITQAERRIEAELRGLLEMAPFARVSIELRGIGHSTTTDGIRGRLYPAPSVRVLLTL